MIVGIGSDLANIERIGRTLERFGDRFRTRVFTDDERAKCDDQTNPAACYAKRWAAKEACAKALGTGIGIHVEWWDMEVISLPTGQPSLRLSGGASAQLTTLAPPGSAVHVHLSMTDDHPWAQAFVVLEARS